MKQPLKTYWENDFRHGSRTKSFNIEFGGEMNDGTRFQEELEIKCKLFFEADSSGTFFSFYIPNTKFFHVVCRGLIDN